MRSANEIASEHGLTDGIDELDDLCESDRRLLKRDVIAAIRTAQREALEEFGNCQCSGMQDHERCPLCTLIIKHNPKD